MRLLLMFFSLISTMVHAVCPFPLAAIKSHHIITKDTVSLPIWDTCHGGVSNSNASSRAIFMVFDKSNPRGNLFSRTPELDIPVIFSADFNFEYYKPKMVEHEVGVASVALGQLKAFVPKGATNHFRWMTSLHDVARGVDEETINITVTANHIVEVKRHVLVPALATILVTNFSGSQVLKSYFVEQKFLHNPNISVLISNISAISNNVLAINEQGDYAIDGSYTLSGVTSVLVDQKSFENRVMQWSNLIPLEKNSVNVMDAAYKIMVSSHIIEPALFSTWLHKHNFILDKKIYLTP